MADIIDNVISIFSTDSTTAAILFLLGFLVCHILHALRYGFSSFGSPFDKIKKFFKLLLFLKIQ